MNHTKGQKIDPKTVFKKIVEDYSSLPPKTRPEVSEANPQRNKKLNIYGINYHKSAQFVTKINMSNILN